MSNAAENVVHFTSFIFNKIGGGLGCGGGDYSSSGNDDDDYGRVSDDGYGSGGNNTSSSMSCVSLVQVVMAMSRVGYVDGGGD